MIVPGARYYIALGLAVYAGALVATLPAQWVATAVERLAAGRVVMRDASGSAWSGTGKLYARQRAGELLELGAVAWDVAPSSLLSGRLTAQLRADNARQPMLVDVGLSSLTLERVDVEAPVEALAGLASGLHSLGPQGRVRVRSDKLHIEGDSVLGLAEVEWREIRLARLQEVQLGSHVARLRGGGGKVHIELGTLDGPLKLAGRGTWTLDDGLSIAGTAEPHSPKLAAFLKTVCADYRDAHCAFRYPK